MRLLSTVLALGLSTSLSGCGQDTLRSVCISTESTFDIEEALKHLQGEGNERAS